MGQWHGSWRSLDSFQISRAYDPAFTVWQRWQGDKVLLIQRWKVQQVPIDDWWERSSTPWKGNCKGEANSQASLKTQWIELYASRISACVLSKSWSSPSWTVCVSFLFFWILRRTESFCGSTSTNHLNANDLQKTTLCIRTSSITLLPSEKQNFLSESIKGWTLGLASFMKSS